MLAARETKMLSAERMERMIDAPTNEEAAKILEECGYGDLSGLSAKDAGAALEAHIAALFDEVEGMVPEAQLVQLFRLKYDYHNAKALIKAQAMGTDCGAILSQRGTVPPQKLHAAFYEEDYRDIPPVLAQAMVDAAAILARTANPQAADFALDRAYFAQRICAPPCARAAWPKMWTFSRMRSSPAARSARIACSRRLSRPRRSRHSMPTRG